MDTEITIKDPALVKAEIGEYLGNVIDEAQALAISIKDDEGCDQAVTLGSLIKGKIAWLNQKRKEVYEPLRDATERVRVEYDEPLKLGKQLEKTLSAAVIDYRLRQKREAERLRLAAEAEAKRVREEAERKEREAQAERERVVKEREAREQKERDERVAEENRRKAAEEAEKRAAEAKAKAEADARAAKIKEEEDARLRNAQEAHDVGLAERSAAIIDTPTPIAPMPAPLPTAAEREALAEKARAELAAQQAAERQRQAAREAEQKKRDEEAAKLRQMDEEAAQAKARAAEAEAVAQQSLTVKRPDERMRTSVTWKYEIPSTEAFKKLCRAIADGRAPVEYGGFDPQQPEKFRAAAISKDVTRLKDQFDGEGIGIRTWQEEGGSFK